MTDQEFAEAVKHHQKVLSEIRGILMENEMDLKIDTESCQICLEDNGRGIGYTGFEL